MCSYFSVPSTLLFGRVRMDADVKGPKSSAVASQTSPQLSPHLPPPSTSTIAVSTSWNRDLTDFSNALGIFVIKDTVLREVRAGTFDSTPNIGALGFTTTELQDLPDALFQNLQKLESLKLNSNKLLVLRPNWFSLLAGLKVLDLSKNLFTSVPVETFHLLLSCNTFGFLETISVNYLERHSRVSLSWKPYGLTKTRYRNSPLEVSMTLETWRNYPYMTI